LHLAPEPVADAPVFDAMEPTGPAHAQLGSEGLARLRARYAEVMAAISRRVPDQARAEQLKADADRLNPDSWVTAEEVRQGIERYEAVFESLREALGRRRRRRRGPGPSGDHAAPDVAEE
jgi:hypothetical protein